MDIKELIEKDQKQLNMKLLNNRADLTRVVETVESSETPDSPGFISSNSFLLMTGMVFQNNQSALCNLIVELNELSCAGIGIKLGRFIDHLEPEVIEIADRLEFPIYQIPYNYTLGEVYRTLLSYLWKNKNNELTYALNTQKKLSNLILQGAPIKSILTNLGHTIHKSACIVTPFGEIMETCGDEVIEMERITKELFHSLKLNEGYGEEHHVYLEGDVNKLSIYPLKMTGYNFYYLFIFQSEDLQQIMTNIVIEQVTIILGIVLYKNLYVIYNRLRAKEVFLQMLIKNKDELCLTNNQLLAVGTKYGLEKSIEYSVFIGTLEFFGKREFDVTNFSYREEKYLLTYEWLSNYVEREYGTEVLVFPLIEEYRFVFLVQNMCVNRRVIVQQIYERLKILAQIEVVFSEGNSMQDIESTALSFNEAVEAYNEGSVDSELPYYKHFKPKYAMELFRNLSRSQVESFCVSSLRILAFPTNEKQLELQKTLKIYLENNNSVTQTATIMFLHKNTIKYRIEKCKDILHYNFEDSKYNFQLLLALSLINEQK